MGDLLIRNIPDPIKRDIEKRAADNGKSLSDVAKELLKKGLIEGEDLSERPKSSAADAMARAFSGAQLSDEDHNIFMQAIDDRKRDFDRNH